MSTRDPLFPHLLPAARELLQTDNPQRIQALRADRWIDYPCALEALGRLQELLETPRRGKRSANPSFHPVLSPAISRPLRKAKDARWRWIENGWSGVWRR